MGVVEHRACVFKGGSATCAARVFGANALSITSASIASAKYTISLIDPDDENEDAAVDGHTAVALTVAAVVFDELQQGGIWLADSVGYNFAHTIDVSSHAAFALRRREYRIVYELQPVSGQVIIVDFRVKVV